MSYPARKIPSMTLSGLLMGSSVVGLLGSLSYAAVATSEGQLKRTGLSYTRGLWLTAGILGVSIVVISVIGWATEGMAGHAAGDIIVGIFMGVMLTAVSVCLLGLTGFWAALRRNFRPRSAAPRNYER